LDRDIKFSFIIANNLLEEILKLSESEDERKELRSAGSEINEYHGFVKFPTEKNDIYYLFVNIGRFNETKIHLQTITHEYTHILDFDEYAKEYKIKNMNWKQNIPYYDSIHFLSEARARYRSTLIYYNVVNFDKEDAFNIVEELSLEYSKELEGDFRTDYYLIAQLYGQYLAMSRYAEKQIDRPQVLSKYKAEVLLSSIDSIIDSDSIFPCFYEYKNIFYDTINFIT